jgi:hypothetical protein
LTTSRKKSKLRCLARLLFAFFLSSSENLVKSTLLKFPKEGELSEYESVRQEDHIIQGEYENIIKDRRRGRITLLSGQKSEDRLFNKKNSEASAGKNNENDHYLKRASEFPPVLKSIYPGSLLHSCGYKSFGELSWFIESSIFKNS